MPGCKADLQRYVEATPAPAGGAGAKPGAMSLLLLPHVKRSPSLCFAEYYALEKQAGAARSGVSACGALLEYETLELRVQPPSVEVASRGDSTTVSVFSANRAGTLVEVRSGVAGRAERPRRCRSGRAGGANACLSPRQVVQHFTELGLNVKSARISSDGGWFVDEFEVTESNGSRVKDARKLQSITRVRHMCLPPPAGCRPVLALTRGAAGRCWTCTSARPRWRRPTQVDPRPHPFRHVAPSARGPATTCFGQRSVCGGWGLLQVYTRAGGGRRRGLPLTRRMLRFSMAERAGSCPPARAASGAAHVVGRREGVRAGRITRIGGRGGRMPADRTGFAGASQCGRIVPGSGGRGKAPAQALRAYVQPTKCGS